MIPSGEVRAAPAKGGHKVFPAGAARCVARCWLGLILCGCYRYVPVDLGSVQRAEFVRVDVTEQAAVRLVKDFGAYLTSLEGQFSREGTDSVSVTVPVSRDYRGVSLEGGRQTLFLGLQEVKGVRRREFSRSRKMAVSVGSLMVFAAIVAGVAQWGDPNSEVVEPPPPPPPSGVILFRLRIP
jgi:hypothetical protein